jgi:hypothetical protein
MSVGGLSSRTSLRNCLFFRLILRLNVSSAVRYSLSTYWGMVPHVVLCLRHDYRQFVKSPKKIILYFTLFIREKSRRAKKNCTNLIADDCREEEAVGQDLLDMREELIPRGTEGDVGRLGRASAAGEDGDDIARPVEDGGARVAIVGERAVPVGDKGGLEGFEDNVDVVLELEVVTDPRSEAI